MKILINHIVRLARFACLLFFFSFFVGDKALADSAPPESGPSFRYLFAHRVLPHVLHNEPQIALGFAFYEKGQALLLDIWNTFRKRHPLAAGASGPTPGIVQGGELDDHTAFALISMPAPEDSPEAYYVCLIVPYVITSEKTLRASSVLYYTLEKSVDFDFNFDLEEQAALRPQNAQPTVIGSWAKDGSHSNYGAGPTPDSPDLFIKAAIKLYSGEK